MQKGITIKNANGIGPVKILSERSELVDEIVSATPGLLIRRGYFILSGIVVLMITVSWFVRYPDVINTTAKLTSINAPKPVITHVAGKLVSLKVAENHLVEKRDILAYIESTADHDEVLRLVYRLDSIQQLLDAGQSQHLSEYLRQTPSVLGELQADYQNFSQELLSLTNYLSNGFYMKKKMMLVKDQGNLLKLEMNLQEQKKIHEQDLKITERTFAANESLKNDMVISDFDYRAEQSKLLNKKLTLPQINSALLNNERQRLDKEGEIIELENSFNEQKLIFQQALNTFRSRLQEWRLKYVLEAPIRGKVAFASFLQENQQLAANQPICYINPENSHYFVEVTIPQSNFGKVRIGQSVLLRFPSYPFQEFGAVVGSIEFIGNIPNESGYPAKIALEKGLITTSGVELQYREGLTAEAEIITDNLRLLERFYYKLLKGTNTNAK